jgi:hypothetical protein
VQLLRLVEGQKIQEEEQQQLYGHQIVIKYKKDKNKKIKKKQSHEYR